MMGSVDVRVVEVIFEGVKEVGVGKLVVNGDDAFAEHLEWVHVVHIHGHC